MKVTEVRALERFSQAKIQKPTKIRYNGLDFGPGSFYSTYTSMLNLCKRFLLMLNFVLASILVK